MLLSIDRYPSVNNALFFTIENALGMRIVLCNVGASIRSIALPFNHGLHLVTPEVDDTTFFSRDYLWGKTLGRVSGLLCHSVIQIDDNSFALEPMEGTHTLHGGQHNFAFKTFDYEIRYEPTGCAIVFQYRSPFGEGGFPGQLMMSVTYRLFDHSNQIDVTYEAHTDFPTVLNPSFMMPMQLITSNHHLNDYHFIFHASDWIEENEEHCPIQFTPIPKEVRDEIKSNQGLSEKLVQRTYHLNEAKVMLSSPLSPWQLIMTTSYPDMRIEPAPRDVTCAFLFHQSPMRMEALVVRPNEKFSQTITYLFVDSNPKKI